MKVVIVDDEYNSVENLKTHLEDYPELEVISTFTDPVEALAYLIRKEVDLLFLDVEMPSISGLYIAEQITLLHPNTKICFITAHTEGAIKAFELNALDYIQKPFSDERLKKCIDKIRKESSVQRPDYDSISHDIEYPLNIICGYHDEDIVLINAEPHAVTCQLIVHQILAAQQVHFMDINHSTSLLHWPRRTCRRPRPDRVKKGAAKISAAPLL